jgi:hypothetical protein
MIEKLLTNGNRLREFDKIETLDIKDHNSIEIKHHIIWTNSKYSQ